MISCELCIAFEYFFALISRWADSAMFWTWPVKSYIFHCLCWQEVGSAQKTGTRDHNNFFIANVALLLATGNIGFQSLEECTVDDGYSSCFHIDHVQIAVACLSDDCKFTMTMNINIFTCQLVLLDKSNWIIFFLNSFMSRVFVPLSNIHPIITW